MLKDTKVKNNQLVTRNDQPIVVDSKMYDIFISLFTNEKVLDGLKFIYVPVVVDGENSTLHLEINSYISTPGRQLIFISEKYCLVVQR